MEINTLIEVLGSLEKLKCNLRHSWTSSGRQESVAEHSWRLAVMALLIQDEFPSLDMARVIKMCLVHDWGEAITGDIPTFVKTSTDKDNENIAVTQLLSKLPAQEAGEYAQLFHEMEQCATDEAKLFHALDKLEVLIQHNEADIETWIPLEFELNLIHGINECGHFEYSSSLRELVKSITENKIAASL